ncbi:MAG: S41 family peptidase [Gammaproteobacteria bacterium]|nr:S41 family peptidase [Gammaproteobacteria bacterium]
MKYRHRFFLPVALLLCLGPLALGKVAWAEPKQPPKPENVPINELRTFAEIFGRIKKDYVEPVEDGVLLEYAIKGMLSGLDPHSSYLNAEDYKDLQAGTTGKFGGLGIEIGVENGFIKVISPIDDTPAQRAGVKAGDLIIRLDEKPVKGIGLSKAVKTMRGKPGTSITLTILREQVEKPFKISIKRDIINVASVKSRILEPGFGYVRISNFQSRTSEDMHKAITSLKAKGEMQGLILDLRNNPGGILNSAVEVSDAYLTEGKIVYTEGKTAGSKLSFVAKPDDILQGAPMVVLVNEGSASASEIVAGALQDHKRALIMGVRTFGKGSVQSIVPVTKKAAIKLTTARYFTPSGRSIQAEGIKPDIELPVLEVKSSQHVAVDSVKEADLSGHLANGNGKKKPTKDGDEIKAKAKPLAVTDYQLYEALNLLKGLSLLKGMGAKG